jgi:hypothetical protein
MRGHTLWCSIYISTLWEEVSILLKVPKREIFVTELFVLSDSIWVGDLRTEPKNPFV